MSHYDKNESEKRLRLAVSAGHMGTWDRNFLSGQLNWSVECKAMFGLAPETEMNDERFMQAIHPEDRAPTDLAVREALEKQIDFNSEYRVIWPDGTIHWIAAVGHGYYNEAGQAIRMSGVTLDITERKGAEEILQESERRFRSLFENMLNGFAYCKMLFDGDRPQDFIYLNVNRSFETQTGLKDVVGKKVSEVIPGILEFNRDLIALYGRVALTGKPEVTETYVASLNMWFSISAYSPQKECFVAIFDVITERKQAEEELRESEDKFKHVFDYSVTGKSITLPSGEITVNRAFCDMVGYSQEELKGGKWQEITHPDDIELAQNIANLLLSGEKESARFVKRYIHKNGSVVWTDVGTVLRRDKDGTPLYFMTSVNDITERKQAEDARQQSETLFRMLFELSPDAVVLLDPHDPNISSQIVDCNAAACLMNGYDRDEMIGHSIDIVKADPYTQTEQAAYLKKLRDAGNLKYEVFHRRKNGVVFPVEISTAIIKVGERELVIGIDRDITERKQAEEAIRASEALMRYIVRYDPNAIAVYDSNLHYLAVSDRYLRDYNLKEQEIIGRHHYEVFPEMPQKWKEVHQRCLDGAIEGNDDDSFVRPDGSVTYNRWECRPWRLANGDIGGIITYTEVTSERKQAENKIRQLNADLEQRVENRTRELRDAQEQLVRQERLATLGQLAGSIGHELRNPLGVISNAVYFLKLSQPDASDIVKEYLDIIEKETRTSDKIVTDLLDFTRTKSLDRQPASVSELVSQALERQPAPPSIDVAVEISADLPKIYADPLHVIQVLVNLISNACQAMDSGATNEGKLKVSAAAQGAMIKIDVQDTGVGIPPENTEKIFEPLFTTKTKGIGLGLAVSRKLTEANGGRIEAESEAGRGSTFTVYLPVYKSRNNTE